VDEGTIALVGTDGKAENLTATKLGRLLADHRSLRLVLLNACEGARASERDVFSSTAATLVKRGIPVILAMQYAISDQAAIEFSSSFYSALADSMPVDAAVAEARKAVSLAAEDTLEWGTPVLYMRSPDGALFRVKTREADGKSENSTEPEAQNVSAIRDVSAQEAERLQELYARGVECLDKEVWEEAEKAFRELIGVDPEYRNAWQKLGEAKTGMRESKERGRRKQDLEDLYRAGKACYDRRRWEAAVRYLETIVNSGENYEDAADLLKRAERKLELQSIYIEAEVRLKDGGWAEAITLLLRIVQIDQSYKDSTAKLDYARRQRRLQSLYDQALKDLHSGNWDQAIEGFEAILREEPDYPDAVDRLKKAKENKQIAATESPRRRNGFTEFLRDPVWQGIGGVVAIVALVITIYTLFRRSPRAPVEPTLTSKPPILCNGDFERDLDCWQHGGDLGCGIQSEGGQHFLVLGSPDYDCQGGVPVGQAWVKQTFKVPQTFGPTLALRYRVFSQDLDFYDFFQVSIDDEPVGQYGNTDEPVGQYGNTEWNASSCDREAWDSGWQHVEFDLGSYSGESIEISLRDVNGEHEWWNTWTYVDDVEIH